MAQTASPRRVHQYQNNSPVLYHRGGYKYSVYLELSPFVSEDKILCVTLAKAETSPRSRAETSATPSPLLTINASPMNNWLRWIQLLVLVTATFQWFYTSSNMLLLTRLVHFFSN